MGLFSPDYPDECDLKVVAAAHEVGHAVADWAGGMTVRSVKLRFGVFGDTVGGIAKIKERELPEHQVAAYAISCLAGAESEAHYLARHYGVSLGRARRIVEPGLEASDLGEFKRAAKYAGLSRSDGQHQAERLVRRYTAKIDKLAAKLARKHTLTGWDF